MPTKLIRPDGEAPVADDGLLDTQARHKVMASSLSNVLDSFLSNEAVDLDEQHDCAGAMGRASTRERERERIERWAQRERARRGAPLNDDLDDEDV